MNEGHPPRLISHDPDAPSMTDGEIGKLISESKGIIASQDSNAVYVSTAEGLRNEAIRIMPRSRRDGTNWAVLELLEATACPNTHVSLIHLNGRLCYVTAPINVSIEEIKRDLEEMGKEMETARLMGNMKQMLEEMGVAGLNEHSQPAPKPKQNHNWYKFNQRNKYGR